MIKGKTFFVGDLVTMITKTSKRKKVFRIIEKLPDYKKYKVEVLTSDLGTHHRGTKVWCPEEVVESLYDVQIIRASKVVGILYD